MNPTKVITVFTPTYNRAFCIDRVYKSLLRQANKGFTWLIVDDGSTDDTEGLFNGWILEGLLDIKYVKQQNKGMLGAHNTAHKMLDTELAICIDSDDYLADNAINLICEIWNEIKDDKNISGIIGLDAFEDGNIIGEKFAAPSTKMNFFNTLNFVGDKKYIYRTDLLKKYGPYPEIPNEKFPAQSYIYRKIGEHYDSYVVNDVFCIVEYLEGGNSANKITSYRKNPIGFRLYRELCMQVEPKLKDRLRNSVHYVSCCLFSKEYKKIFINKHWYYTIFTFPFGAILNIYISRTKSTSVNKKLNL